MKRLSVISGLIVLILVVGFKPESKKPASEEIEWVTFEEAIELNKKKPKKIFVDVYTDWCGWCKRMDKATFQQEEVAKYMNKNFYCVKFDAEGKKDVQVGEKVYKNTGRSHQLAKELLDGKMSYPTVVFLDERFSKLSPVPGYRGPEDFLHIARFFGDDVYKTKNWDQYNQDSGQ